MRNYCEAHTSALPDYMKALERETHLKTLSPQMLSGPVQGQLLKLISQMITPVKVLEIGTFTGYSAICLAYGLAENGHLQTIEVNPELAGIIRKYIGLAGMDEKIKLHLGDAATIIPTLDGPFDLVWIDAGKQNYAHHYDLVIDNVRPGGFILADNVLWDGKVYAKNIKDKDAQALHAFNEKIQADPRVENVILPIRDGIMIARKMMVA
jgi:predicted O-methyltransferase YrrM